MRAAIYARISDDRGGAGLGVARQEADCRALAQQRGWHVEHLLVDNDLSAFSGKRRPQYEQLLELIAAGGVDTVITWHADRLHRSPVELERYISVCEPRDVPTVTVRAGTLDLATPSGRMVARMLGSAARYESEHKSDRARRKALELAQAGRPSGGLRAFGYDPDRLTVRPDEAAVIVDAAGRVLAGESLRAIVADLTARHVPTVTGAAWSATTLRAMLLRARYAGLREHRGATYPATWPAILDLDVHLALRALLSDPARDRGGRGRTMLLTGLLRCGVQECGVPVTTHHGGSDRPGTSRVSYVCTGCQNYGAAVGCDERVIAVVLDRLAHPQVLADLNDPIDTGADEQTVLAGRARLVEIGEQFGLDAAMPVETVRAMVAKVQERIALAERRLAGRADRRSTPLPIVDRAGWNALPLDTRRAMVAALAPTLLLDRPTSTRRAFDPSRVRVD